MSQFELFTQPIAQSSTEPSIDAVRVRLEAVLKTPREAEVMPLSERKLANWTTAAPQMTKSIA